MKKVIFLCVLCSVFLLTGCCISHEWQEATCTEPKTCVKCGKTEGEVIEHEWKEATCTEPKTCVKCGKTEGEVIEHEWKEATCTAPKTCINCGFTEGEVAEHKWKYVACEEPEVCSVCGEKGEISKHKYQAATCTTPKKCEKCGKTKGEKLEHSLDENGTCIYCEKRIGFALNSSNFHDYINVKSDRYAYSEGRAKNYYMTWFYVEPLKNVKFSNVQITYRLGSVFVSSSEDDEYVTVYLDENGYATSEGVSYNQNNPQQWYFDSITGCVIE